MNYLMHAGYLMAGTHFAQIILIKNNLPNRMNPERQIEMNIEGRPIESALSKLTEVEKVKCSRCNCELKSPSEWLRSKNRVLCEICYLNLLYPNSSRGVDGPCD
jgi:hypothetical protein